MFKVHNVLAFAGWTRGENTERATAVRFFEHDGHTDFPIVGWVDRRGGFALPVVESAGKPVDLLAVIDERVTAAGVAKFDTVWP